jgi:hypothetical protein
MDLKLLQTFATVSLLKDPITSFIFWIRSLVLLRDFAMSHTSDSPHTTERKELLSGELDGQTSSSYTSATYHKASMSQSCVLLI